MSFVERNSFRFVFFAPGCVAISCPHLRHWFIRRRRNRSRIPIPLGKMLTLRASLTFTSVGRPRRIIPGDKVRQWQSLLKQVLTNPDDLFRLLLWLLYSWHTKRQLCCTSPDGSCLLWFSHVTRRLRCVARACTRCRGRRTSSGRPRNRSMTTTPLNRAVMERITA